MRLKFWTWVKIVRVSGNSMQPTFKSGAVLLFLKKTLNDLQRGSIVLYKHSNKWLVKRLIGFPLEFIEIREKQLIIDGKLIKEDYLELARESNQISKWLTETNQFVILGDNSDDSLDSRSFNSVSFDKEIYIYSRTLRS